MSFAAALPVAPILLLPFLVLFFIVVFPLWLVAVAVLFPLLWIVRGAEWALRRGGVDVGRPVSGPLGRAAHWVLSWGGIAQRRDVGGGGRSGS